MSDSIDNACVTAVSPAPDDPGLYVYECRCQYRSMPLPEDQARRFARMHETGKLKESA